MFPKRIFPSGAAAAAVLAMGMTFALPASAADESAKAGVTAANCMQSVQATERAVDSLGPESPGHKTLMQQKVQQARGECADGQFANAQSTLKDVQAQLRAEGTSTDATARKGGATGAAATSGSATATSRTATTEERTQYCIQRALRTENAIGSLGPESSGGKTLMQSRVKQAHGLCMEGQIAEANDILMDLDQSLEGEGVPNANKGNTTGTQAK